MAFRIQNQKDFAAGLIYMAFGAAFSIGALNYKLGDAARMGPGYFPFWIGVILAFVGLVTAVRGLRSTTEAESLKRPDLRSLAWIIGAVVLFGVLLEPLGLVLSLAILVLVSMRGSHEFRWLDALLTAVVLIAFSVAAFIWGIELQIDLWPRFLGL
jgi:hypothetical protein